MAHEAVEVTAIGFLPEFDCHGPPMVFVQPRLMGGFQPHEDEVAHQVCLAQLTPGGVHALKDELGVVLVAAERDVYDHQLGEAFAQGRQVVLQGSDLCLEELEVFLHPDGVILGQVLLLHDGQEGLLVGLGQQELEAALAVLQRI